MSLKVTYKMDQRLDQITSALSNYIEKNGIGGSKKQLIDIASLGNYYFATDKFKVKEIFPQVTIKFPRRIKQPLFHFLLEDTGAIWYMEIFHLISMSVYLTQ